MIPDQSRTNPGRGRPEPDGARVTRVWPLRAEGVGSIMARGFYQEGHMAFDWMTAEVAAGATERAAQGRKRVAEGEIRARARVMRSLGWGRERAERRLVANQKWEFEVAGTPPLVESEVHVIVDEVFG